MRFPQTSSYQEGQHDSRVVLSQSQQLHGLGVWLLFRACSVSFVCTAFSPHCSGRLHRVMKSNHQFHINFFFVRPQREIKNTY